MKRSLILKNLRRIESDIIYNAVYGGLRETINLHGPIEKKLIFSAAKRITGQIKTLIHNLEQEEEKPDV